MRIDGTQTIKGIRTNCFDGKENEAILSYYLRAGSLYKLWFHLLYGVTGYESFEFNPESIERLRKTGWSACAGTKDRWDSLFIPAEEMAKAIDDICQLYIKEK